MLNNMPLDVSTSENSEILKIKKMKAELVARITAK